MINGYPTRDELKNRIERQLSWHSGEPLVQALWNGYLGALLEWGLIEVGVYDELMDLVKSDQILLNCIGFELFSDEPITKEQEAEIIKHKVKTATTKDQA